MNRARGSRLERRIGEIQRENVRAAKTEKRCPGCGCTRAERCVLAVRDAGGELVMAGLCARPGEIGKRCSGCLTPELRVDFAAWRWAGPDEIVMENPKAKLDEAIAAARAFYMEAE